jgi:hypothetical protein
VSNLLQRLAAQATGSAAPGVRSAARVRGAEPLGTSGEAPSAESPALERPFIGEGPSRERGAHEERVGDQRRAQIAGVPNVASSEPLLELRSLISLPDAPSASRNEASRAEPRLPSPLLDLQRPQPTLAARPVVRVEGTAAAVREAEPTEVHVHIGRIEITAEKAPVPARPKPKAARSPMELGDYLAKRQRRAP